MKSRFPLDDSELRRWFHRFGPPSLNQEMDDVNWTVLLNRVRSQTPNTRQLRFLAIGAGLLAMLVALPLALHPGKPLTLRPAKPPARSPANLTVPAISLAHTQPAPARTSGTYVNTHAVSTLGSVAFISHGSLWAVPSGGSLTQIAQNASTPAWSHQSQYLGYIVSTPLQNGQIGAHPVLDVWDAQTHQHVLSVPHVYQYAWRPNHAQLVAIANQQLLLITFTARGVVLSHLGDPKSHYTSILWSHTGLTLYASLRSGSALSGQQFGTLEAFSRLSTHPHPTTLLRLKQTGIQLAGTVPLHHTVLYWTDPQFSASMMADGALLFAFQVLTHKTTPVGSSLPHPGYLSIPSGNPWVFMSGGGRQMTGGKGVTFVHVTRHTAALTTPKDQEFIEPAWNAQTGSLAMVVAQNQPTVFGGASLVHWQNTRTLVVWHKGKLTPWLAAGAGVTDPHWIPGGHGILFIRQGWLWSMANASATPQRVLGPLSDTGPGYYGEISWSSIVAFSF